MEEKLQTFHLVRHEKVMIWKKYPLTVKALGFEHALQIAAGKENTQYWYDHPNLEFGSSRYLDETEDLMDVSDNNGGPTVEITDEIGNVCWTNKEE